MIKVYDIVPKVYYNRSRDFQVLGRLYEIVFNYIKNNVDMISHQPLNIAGQNKFLDLLCTTLGLKLDHQYDDEQLSLLCGVFLQAIRNKGNLKSIRLILNLLISLEGCSEEAYLEQSLDGTLFIYVPNEINDLLLFRDVLEYIVPTGLDYRIINQSITIQTLGTEVTNNDEINVKVINPQDLIMVTKLNSEGNQIISDIDSKYNEGVVATIENRKMNTHEGFVVSSIDNLSLNRNKIISTDSE